MRAQQIDEKAIFKVACCIESIEARNDYLNQVCGDDQKVRSRVAILLRMQAESPSFMESPLVGGDATLDVGPALELPGTQIGPYKLLEQIGEGGMGVVYMASQREPVRRTVALKIIKPGMDTREVVDPLRSRAAGPGHDGSPEHRQGVRCRCDRRGTTVLRDGAGQGEARSPNTAIASNSRRASGWSCSSPSATACSTRIRRA